MQDSVTSTRIRSIDILRGIIMIVMALDHTRDYFHPFKGDLLDVHHASTALFLTRWVTHFCAPIFVFLSGTSAFLSSTKAASKKEVAFKLLTRGLWLVVLELTIVRFGWLFNVDYTFMVGQVIWAIGWSMVALSVLIYLPLPAIAAFGLIMIFGHNLLDGIQSQDFGSNSAWWKILHEQAPIQFGTGYVFFVAYPLIPWIGVMATGYCLGRIMQKPEEERNKWLYRIGITAIVLFIAIRWSNVYGDPKPWEAQPTIWRSILSFVNVQKYPPSLLYLLMTIGPGITSLPLLEKLTNGLGRFFTVYGRVPMFYYILHLYLLHSMQLIVGSVKGIPLHYFTSNNIMFASIPHWGFSLLSVYGFWLTAVLLLYFPCRWFMRIKATHKKWWLSYL